MVCIYLLSSGVGRKEMHVCNINRKSRGIVGWCGGRYGKGSSIARRRSFTCRSLGARLALFSLFGAAARNTARLLSFSTVLLSPPQEAAPETGFLISFFVLFVLFFFFVVFFLFSLPFTSRLSLLCCSRGLTDYSSDLRCSNTRVCFCL